MNPVTQFEQSAKTVWKSDLSANEKRKRLRSIRAAIDHYLGRLNGTAESGKWESLCLSRVRNYLKQLAQDVEDLAVECDLEAAAGRPPSTRKSYAA